MRAGILGAMTEEPSLPTVVSTEAPLYAASLGPLGLMIVIVLTVAALAAVVVWWRRRARRPYNSRDSQ
jgi:hypothetical protein